MPAGTRPRAGRGPIRFELARSGSAGPQPGQRSTELCPGRPQPGQRSTELCPERPRPGPPGTPNFTPIHRPASGGHKTLQSGARDRARPTRIGPVRTGSDGRSDGRTGRSARDDPVPGLLVSRILHLSTGPHRGPIALHSGARDGGPSRAPLYRRCLVTYFDECNNRASRAHAVRHVQCV